jgi:hypothetical protein
MPDAERLGTRGRASLQLRRTVVSVAAGCATSIELSTSWEVSAKKTHPRSGDTTLREEDRIVIFLSIERDFERHTERSRRVQRFAGFICATKPIYRAESDRHLPSAQGGTKKSQPPLSAPICGASVTSARDPVHRAIVLELTTWKHERTLLLTSPANRPSAFGAISESFARVHLGKGFHIAAACCANGELAHASFPALNSRPR